jgi:hypothetical protein
MRMIANGPESRELPAGGSALRVSSRSA